MRYGYEKVALCTRGKCNHGPSRHKGIMSGDHDYRSAQEVGDCRDCRCEGFDPTWSERFQSCRICGWGYAITMSECPVAYNHKLRCAEQFQWAGTVQPCERAEGHFGMHYFHPVQSDE